MKPPITFEEFWANFYKFLQREDAGESQISEVREDLEKLWLEAYKEGES